MSHQELITDTKKGAAEGKRILAEIRSKRLKG